MAEGSSLPLPGLSRDELWGAQTLIALMSTETLRYLAADLADSLAHTAATGCPTEIEALPIVHQLHQVVLAELEVLSGRWDGRPH